MLEWLIALWRRVRKGNGRMAICGVSDVGHEILRTTRLDTIWQLRDTRDAAIDFV